MIAYWLKSWCWRKYCLIKIDSLGFTVEKTMRLREEVARNINQSNQHVMICLSHTHSAPNAAIEDKYYDKVFLSVVNALKTAEDRLVPVKIKWGCGEGSIGVNRRDEKGAVDNRIGILKIVNSKTDKLETGMEEIEELADDVLTYLNTNEGADLLVAGTEGPGDDFMSISSRIDWADSQRYIPLGGRVHKNGG